MDVMRDVIKWAIFLYLQNFTIHIIEKCIIMIIFIQNY